MFYAWETENLKDRVFVAACLFESNERKRGRVVRVIYCENKRRHSLSISCGKRQTEMEFYSMRHYYLQVFHVLHLAVGVFCQQVVQQSMFHIRVSSLVSAYI